MDGDNDVWGSLGGLIESVGVSAATVIDATKASPGGATVPPQPNPFPGQAGSYASAQVKQNQGSGVPFASQFGLSGGTMGIILVILALILLPRMLRG